MHQQICTTVHSVAEQVFMHVYTEYTNTQQVQTIWNQGFKLWWTPPILQSLELELFR